MEHDYRKINQLIGWLLLIIAVCLSSSLIIVGSSGATDPAQADSGAAPVAKLAIQERAQLTDTLSGLLLCGDWPITSTALSAGRGNPFEPKKAQLRLFIIPGGNNLESGLPQSSCRTVQEALNK